MPSSPPRPTLHFTVILILAAIGTGLAAVGGWRYARASAPVSGPIIMVSIDTLRADHLPAYGYRKVRTPAIDALANDGIVFERAYSHAPQTLPAHASILSGRLPFETGVRDNVGFTVKPGERLLPQMLHERGYTTGGVVSSYVLRKDTGIDQGFDFFDAEMPPGSPERAIDQAQRDGGDSEAVAENWLDTQRSSRVFLFLHLYEPHRPYAPPARFAEFAPYDGEIAYADEIVGRLIGYLKTHDLYDRSTIVLLSDHGEGLGDHGEQEHGLLVYDEAVHVPLIIKQPGGVGGGRRVADPVQHVDLVPTILDLVKAPIPGTLRGRSLKPLLDHTGQFPERAIYTEALYGRYHFGWSELTALTESRYRYIKAPREELYDLQRDPDERENITANLAQTRQALGGTLDRLVAGTTIQTPKDISAEDRERLQALGYVGAQTDVGSSVASGTLPDPKDKWKLLESYRAAVDLAGDRKWGQAILKLQQMVAEDPEMVDAWSQLATFATRTDRLDQAIDAYTHVIELKPSDPNGYLGASAVLLRAKKLEAAQAHAELAARLAVKTDVRSRASAHEMLARIALARRDAETARHEAGLVREADPTLPMPAYIEARLLSDEGKFAEALPLFEQALDELQKSRAVQLAELHSDAADTFGRLGRHTEAEAQFVEELRYFPQNTRARAGLATLYQATGRADAAAEVIAAMTREMPTPDAYALAAHLWTTFGNPKQARAVRAEARRTFAAPARGRARPSGR